MPGDVFYFLLNMSLIASACGLIVLLLRSIKRLPRRVAALLWAIPFIRAVVPVAVNSRFSLMGLLSGLSVRFVTVELPFGADGTSAVNAVMAAEEYFPITYKTDLLAETFRIASIVWLVGAAAILIALTAIYIATMHELRDAGPLGGGLYRSDKVTGPAVYGVFRPRIVFPAAGEVNEYALRHERAHVRRLDNLWRILAFACCALHWFNPVFWVLLRVFLSDLELACDETALRGLDAEQRNAYALALVESARSKDVFASAFGGARIRTRVERVLSYKGMTWLSLAAFLLLAGAVAVVLVTNPR